jgi:hypothetical protein
MNISAVSSLINQLPELASNLSAGSTNARITVAILKDILDTEQEQGEALVKMLRTTSSADGTGRMVDVSA